MNNNDLMAVIEKSKFDIDGHLLLYISSPIMFAVKKERMYILVYVMQDRNIVKRNERCWVKDLLLAEVNKEELLSLVKGEVSIYSVFEESSKKTRLSKISNKYFPEIDVLDLSSLEGKLPKRNVRLNSPNIPNKVNLSKLILEIESYN